MLSRDSNYVVAVIMCPKFGNCSTLTREVIITQFYKDWIGKTTFFEGWLWFKFNILGLTLAITFTFYTSVEKVLNLKVRQFLGLILMLIEVTGEKLVWRGVLLLLPQLE